MIVCLHGLGRAPSDWDGVREGLERHAPVRAPALPRSPAGALEQASAEIEAGDLVIGHSMGGVLALRLATERPRPLRGLVLTGCFFPPARNGRPFGATAADYAAHRVAFVRSMRRGGDRRRASSARAVASLVRFGLGGRRDPGCPVLVVHARDDHHVPIDFALGAAAGRDGWTVRVLDSGGHHAHVEEPKLWLAAVAPWLGELAARDG